MPWPPRVLRQFQKVPINPSDFDFHGPYNKLLNTLFPADTDFTVVPQYLRPNSRESTDFVAMFEVFYDDKPVFILEIKSPEVLRYASLRQIADQQVRDRIGDLYSGCPIPTLHAVSAAGTALCFYTHRNLRTEPLPIPRHPELTTDCVPRERWDCDILEDEGEQRFRAVMEEIKQACAQL